jgi:hypothetical protein
MKYTQFKRNYIREENGKMKVALDKVKAKTEKITR